MRTFALLLAACALLFAVLAPLPFDDPKPDRARVAALIEQLGADEYAKREAAVKALTALGGKALPALIDAAATTDDLEVRYRARRLVRQLLPDSHKSASAGLKLVRVDAGAFQMGAPPGEAGRRVEEVEHHVQITRPFFLGATEVTQEQYLEVMKVDPSWFTAKGGGRDKIDVAVTALYPVERVSWFDAIDFCNRLSRRDGLDAYYKVTAIERDGDSIKRATVAVLGGRGYRLPTEAEWEFACRGGAATAFHFGREVRENDANVKPIMVGSGYGMSPKWRDLNRTTRVGSYQPNKLGLYDMHGNVAEWCQDWYDKDYYGVSPKADPPGPTTGLHRVLRGGSWLVTEGSCRSASRAAAAPWEGSYYGGFRVARNP